MEQEEKLKAGHLEESLPYMLCGVRLSRLRTKTHFPPTLSKKR